MHEGDSKLRGCDLMALRVDDVATNGYAVDRATGAGPFASSSPSQRARLSTTIFASPAASRGTTVPGPQGSRSLP